MGEADYQSFLWLNRCDVWLSKTSCESGWIELQVALSTVFWNWFTVNTIQIFSREKRERNGFRWRDQMNPIPVNAISRYVSSRVMVRDHYYSDVELGGGWARGKQHATCEFFFVHGREQFSGDQGAQDCLKRCFLGKVFTPSSNHLERVEKFRPA